MGFKNGVNSIIPNYILHICLYRYRSIQSRPCSKETSFCNRDHYRNHDQSKCRVGDPSPSANIYKTTSTPKAQGSLQDRGRKIIRARELGVCSEMCLLGMLEAAPRVSSEWLPKHQLNNNNKRHTNMRGVVFSYTHIHMHTNSHTHKMQSTKESQEWKKKKKRLPQ